MSKRRPMLSDVLCECDRLRQSLEIERASRRTADSYAAKRGEVIRQLEEAVTVFRCRCAELEQALLFARAHPVEIPRQREHLPDTRRALGIKLRINRDYCKRCTACGARDPDAPPATSLHLHLGFFDDSRLGELFVRLDRERRSDVASAFADQWATAFSYVLQHGLSPTWLLEKARYVRDGSGGVPYVWSEERGRYERHPVIHHVSSVIDYVSQIIERVLAGKPAARLSPDENPNVPATKETDHV